MASSTHQRPGATAHEPVVLIVEDHPDTSQMLGRFLARNGMASEAVFDGAEALQLLSKRRPACVILDEAMPGITGLELLRRIRNRPELHDLPVVFYSAQYDQLKMAEAESLGAHGWLIKGVSRLTELMDHVRTSADPPPSAQS